MTLRSRQAHRAKRPLSKAFSRRKLGAQRLRRWLPKAPRFAPPTGPRLQALGKTVPSRGPAGTTASSLWCRASALSG
eukprot:14837423-Alexandrium_andersonii.AAC.1